MNLRSKFEQDGDSNKIRIALLAIKYVFSLAIVAYGAYVVGAASYLVAGAFELLAVFVLTNWLGQRNMWLGYLANSVLMLVFNIQSAVLVFGASYVTPIMLSNLFNIQDLAGQATLYLASAALVVLVSFLPIASLRLPLGKKLVQSVVLALAFELLATVAVGVWAAPLASAVDLKFRWDRYVDTLEQTASTANAVEGGVSPEALQAYYREDVPGGIEKPATLPDQPNVIVIFTEGLSQHIIDDERDIMPNVASYQQKSLSFGNYFNHTAATYRGINGQLYSGFQLADLDANRLISIQSILEDQGYYTAFINPEPFFDEWCLFLDYLKFQNLVGTSVTGTYSVGTITELEGTKMSDGESYGTLRSVVEEASQREEPFFVGIYTFGTHATYDSVEEVYGDGSNAELNKFYNCDYQFGQFMNWFEQSELKDNTIVVFTADHATYRDLAFGQAFPDYERVHYFLDRVPCFYYYAGVEPRQIDVGGRTTIDFAPTLLDFLDVSAPNYFVGSSLFTDGKTSQEESIPMDMIYFDGGMYSSTQNSVIVNLEGDELAHYTEKIMDYVSVSRIPL